MPDTFSIILIELILLAAALTRSTLGFGDALVAMPLLAFVVPVRMAAPLVALLSTLNAAIILWREWNEFSLRAALPLILVALAGIPLGAWLLREGDERIVKALLAGVILGFSTWSLRNPSLPELKSRWWILPFGVSAGFLGGAYNTAGPPLVMYAALQRWESEQFRLTLQGYFLPAGLVILLFHANGDLLTCEVLNLFVMSIPLIAVAAVIGRRLSKKIPKQQFVRVVHYFLLMIAVVLLLRAAFG